MTGRGRRRVAPDGLLRHPHSAVQDFYLEIEPGYTPLRKDPRFGELVDRIGLKQGT
jgi:hypothetical protein